MAGYKLEFERNHVPASRQHYQHYELFPIGQVDSVNIVDSEDEVYSVDDSPRGEVEIAAAQVKPPGISENSLAPVNDVCHPFFPSLLPIFLSKCWNVEITMVDHE